MIILQLSIQKIATLGRVTIEKPKLAFPINL